MKPFDQQVPGALDVAFTKIEAHIAALPENKGLALNDAAAGEVLALADQALAGGLVDAHQTARSMASFLEGMGARCIDAQDVIQLQTLLDNLRRDLYPAASRNSPAPAPALVTAIAHSAPTANNRIALYVESRAIRAMLQEVLERTGFAPRNLDAMQSLLDADETDYPAAVIADLSLCQQDSQTLTAMRVLRERFSPAPHLFCLAGGDNFAARLQAVRLGATRFLKKPVDSERLIAILKGVTAQTPTAPFRVLFIDDDQSMTTLYRAAMADIGLVAEIVNDPLLAPAKVDEFQPDVVVTDLYMPSCNGLELAAVLRQDDALADTPILFLSSETNIRQQLTALDLGADDFLTKPVNLEVLQAAVIARAKRARMLKRSRREYRRVAEHLQRIELAIDQHSIVSISDLQGNILYANQRFCDVTGYTEDELVGKNHRLLKSGVHPEAFYREMWDTISQGRTWHGEVCNRRKDGSHYWVDATVTPQLDDQGLPLRYVSVRTDITSLKELQAQLVVAKGEAEAASQAKSVFLAHMSHELKTPLNGILGFAQILQQETAPAPTADQREMLEAMERSGRHLLELINDLVDLAKIETGHLGLQMETVSMPALIRDCLALIRALATRRGISVQVIVEDESLAVHADRIRVKQVLLNLLSNAVKYNTDKGTLTVTCGRRNARVHCAVRDTGPGIPRPLQAELFLPFSRLRQSAGPVEGTGIGLSLSKSLIERMDGRIGVISDEGRGSEFWFELNLADPVS